MTFVLDSISTVHIAIGLADIQFFVTLDLGEFALPQLLQFVIDKSNKTK